MSDAPHWEVAPLPKLWADMTDEEREHIRNGTVPVKLMSREEIERMYGPSVAPE